MLYFFRSVNGKNQDSIHSFLEREPYAESTRLIGPPPVGRASDDETNCSIRSAVTFNAGKAVAASLDKNLLPNSSKCSLDFEPAKMQPPDVFYSENEPHSQESRMDFQLCDGGASKSVRVCYPRLSNCASIDTVNTIVSQHEALSLLDGKCISNATKQTITADGNPRKRFDTIPECLPSSNRTESMHASDSNSNKNIIEPSLQMKARTWPMTNEKKMKDLAASLASGMERAAGKQNTASTSASTSTSKNEVGNRC